MVKILLAPTLEIAKKVNADITIEAEYGNDTIYGKLYTSAHHGKNALNPAPCNDWDIPAILEGIVLISHIDLDTIIGCARVMRNLHNNSHFISFSDNFNRAAEFIDVNGVHHLHKYSNMIQDFFNAYYAWNFENQKNKTRITELTDVTNEIIQSIDILKKIIIDLDEKLLKKGEEWARNILTETESKLIEETKKYRLFLTDRVFCGASYYSPQLSKIIPAIVSYNENFKSITLSFEDGGKRKNAVEIMKHIFGDKAGGRPGIAGTPRGKEFSFDDTKKVIDFLID